MIHVKKQLFLIISILQLFSFYIYNGGGVGAYKIIDLIRCFLRSPQGLRKYIVLLIPLLSSETQIPLSLFTNQDNL